MANKLFLIMLFLNVIWTCKSQYYSLNLTKNNKINVQSSPVPLKNWFAKAFWDLNNYNKTGWSIFEVETNIVQPDFYQAFAAGYLEGFLTKGLITMHLQNIIGNICDVKPAICQRLALYFQENFSWIQKQINSNPTNSYWYQVKLVMIQFQGFYFGYNRIQTVDPTKDILDSIISDPMTYLHLLALQFSADLGDLLQSFNQPVPQLSRTDSCSVLIKVLNNNKDIFISHVTWGDYNTMLRVLKNYKLNYRTSPSDSTLIPGSRVTLSSYPGNFVSLDDYYVINSKLVVTETTLANYNQSAWKLITPKGNGYWIRNIVANRLAKTGNDWAKYFSLYNSGSYSNQWMIVDSKLFQPNKPLQNGLLTVLEQMPGYIYWEDKTTTLRNTSYWASYNVPYYPQVYQIGGYVEKSSQYGNSYSLTKCPRAQIFKRDQANVVDTNSMIKLMRSNNFTKEPFAACDCTPPYSASSAISSRSDLNPDNGIYPFNSRHYHGGIDMKMSNLNMIQSQTFTAIQGPTYDNKDVPPFSWSKSGFNVNHFGQPDTFAFGPYNYVWKFKNN